MAVPPASCAEYCGLTAFANVALPLPTPQGCFCVTWQRTVLVSVCVLQDLTSCQLSWSKRHGYLGQAGNAGHSCCAHAACASSCGSAHCRQRYSGSMCFKCSCKVFVGLRVCGCLHHACRHHLVLYARVCPLPAQMLPAAAPLPTRRQLDALETLLWLRPPDTKQRNAQGARAGLQRWLLLGVLRMLDVQLDDCCMCYVAPEPPGPGSSGGGSTSTSHLLPQPPPLQQQQQAHGLGVALCVRSMQLAPPGSRGSTGSSRRAVGPEVAVAGALPHAVGETFHAALSALSMDLCVCFAWMERGTVTTATTMHTTTTTHPLHCHCLTLRRCFIPTTQQALRLQRCSS